MPGTRMRRVLMGAAALCALGVGSVLPGCGGCRGGTASLSYVPQDALMALVVPSISAGLKETKLLLDKFRDQIPVKMVIDQGKSQIEKELGIDPERPETLKTKGIDPESALVGSLASDAKSVAIVFGVSDGKVLDKTLRELASKMLGGATFQEKVVDGVKVTLVMSAQAADTPQLAWAEVKKQLVLCPVAKDGKLGEHVARIAKLEGSIKSNKTFTGLMEKLGKHQVVFYVDGATAKKVSAAKFEEELRTASDWSRKYIQERKEAVDGFMAYFRGAALSLKIAADGITVRGYLGITPDKGKAVQEILKGSGSSVELGKYIAPDALLCTRFSLNTKKLMDRVVEAMPPGAKRRFYAGIEQIERDAKISVEKDVLGLLSGRFAAAVFAPGADVVDVLKGGAPRGGPMLARMVPATFMAQVTDAGKAAELLSKLERVLVMGHVEVRTRAEGDRRVYTVEDEGKPVLSWTVVKDVAVIATGDRLPKTVSLISSGGDNVLGQIDNSRAKSLLKSDDGQVIYYNIGKTVDLIRSMDLPTELKTILSTPLGTLAKLGDAMVDFEVEDDGVLGEFVLRVK